MKPTTIVSPSRRKAARAVTDETVRDDAASVPRSVIAAVKEHSGSRGFSRFVTAALERELRHVARAQLIEDIVRHTGPLDPAKVKAARKLIRG